MNNKKIIFAIGSRKNSKLFADTVADPAYRVIHIFDDEKDKECKSPEILKQEIENHLNEDDFRPIAFVSFARNTVFNSVENIALLFDNLCADSKYKDAKFVGPFYNAAKIFSDKWIATQQLNKDGFSCLKTLKVDKNSIEEVKKRLIEKKFPLPAVLKATNLTGGVGLQLVQTPDELEVKYRAHIQQGIIESILVEYVEGYEISVEFLYLDGQLFLFPMAFKESTNLSLDHDDSKIKIAGYFNPIIYINNEAIAIGKKYNTRGYFAIEGIICDQKNRTWKITEGMTRFTGSYPMFNATCPPFNTFRAIFNYIDGKPWNKTIIENNIVFQLPVFKKNKSEAEKMVAKIKQLPWMVAARVEDLSELPLSTDNRIRIQITFKAAEKKYFYQQIKKLSDILNEIYLVDRVYSAIKNFNDNFPDLIIKKGVLDRPL